MTAVETSGLVHDAFVYHSEDEFLAGTMPFLEEGLDRREPILAAPTEANGRLLRERLGERAGGIDWAAGPERHRTIERLGIFLDYIHRHQNAGAARIRLLGEPCWPANGGPGVAEWKRYESYLNVALADYPVWLVCPYDAELPGDIVADACLTHPFVGYGPDREACEAYVDPVEFAGTIDRVPLPGPPDDAAERYVRTPAEVRSFVAEQAEAAGVGGEQLSDLKLAASEVGANVFRHAAEIARVRTWAANGSFVCDIDDTGRGFIDPFAGYAVPGPMANRGRGLPMARRLADVVEVRTTPSGGAVRLHFYVE